MSSTFRNRLLASSLLVGAVALASPALAQTPQTGDPAANAAAMRSLLDGAKGAFRDVVLFNSAAALIVAGRVTDLRAGVARAEEAKAAGGETTDNVDAK